MKGIVSSVMLAACLTLSLGAAVTLNQIEDFSQLNGWSSGTPNPNPPVIVPDTGPLGAGDNALRVTSNGGSGAGGKLLVFNQTSWAGDYTTAGIVAIAADLRNTGTNTLSFRLAFNGPGGWFVTPMVAVIAYSGWANQVFDIRPAALVSAGGNNAGSTLAAVSELRILHSAAVDFRGAQVSSSFMVDRIQAIPEPSVVMLGGLGGLALLFRKR